MKEAGARQVMEVMGVEAGTEEADVSGISAAATAAAEWQFLSKFNLSLGHDSACNAAAETAGGGGDDCGGRGQVTS